MATRSHDNLFFAAVETNNLHTVHDVHQKYIAQISPHAYERGLEQALKSNNLTLIRLLTKLSAGHISAATWVRLLLSNHVMANTKRLNICLAASQGTLTSGNYVNILESLITNSHGYRNIDVKARVVYLWNTWMPNIEPTHCRQILLRVIGQQPLSPKVLSQIARKARPALQAPDYNQLFKTASFSGDINAIKMVYAEAGGQLSPTTFSHAAAYCAHRSNPKALRVVVNLAPNRHLPEFRAFLEQSRVEYTFADFVMAFCGQAKSK